MRRREDGGGVNTGNYFVSIAFFVVCPFLEVACVHTPLKHLAKVGFCFVNLARLKISINHSFFVIFWEESLNTWLYLSPIRKSSIASLKFLRSKVCFSGLNLWVQEKASRIWLLLWNLNRKQEKNDQCHSLPMQCHFHILWTQALKWFYSKA